MSAVTVYVPRDAAAFARVGVTRTPVCPGYQ